MRVYFEIIKKVVTKETQYCNGEIPQGIKQDSNDQSQGNSRKEGHRLGMTRGTSTPE